MRQLGRAVVYGLFVWAIPFGIALLLAPLKAKVIAPANYKGGVIALSRHDILRLEEFESIMPIIVAAVAAFFGFAYLQRVRQHLPRHGVWVGVLWVAMCMVIDMALVLPPPVHMPPTLYFADIGMTYLMIPIITFAIAAALTSAAEPAQRIQTPQPAAVPEAP